METTTYYGTIVQQKHREVDSRMKLRYFPDTDTLYIDLRDEPSTESEEIAPDVVADYNVTGQIVGISIDSASTKVDLAAVDASDLPHVRVYSTPPQPPEAVAVGA